MRWRLRRPAAVPPVKPAIRRQVMLSRLALAWERLLPALWPALAIVGAFAVITVFGLWGFAPWWLHLAGLVAFAVALVWALWQARGAFRLPSREAGIRRLERTSGVAHRPLSSVLDRPAAADGAARALWRIHLARAERLLARLRVGWPVTALSKRDPYALRAGIVLLLVVGIAGAGERFWPRIASAFEPDISALTPAGPGRLTAWIAPPDYTGLAPVFLTEARDLGVDAAVFATAAGDDATITAVAGSVLVARVHGGARAPELGYGDTTLAFVGEGEAEFVLEAPLDSEGRLVITQGRHSLGDWQLRLVHDLPPMVALTEPPNQTRRGVLRLDTAAGDDFGLATVTAHAHRPGGDGPVAPIAVALPLSGFEPKQAKSTSYHDLTAHPWAGLEVILEIVATDTAGQQGRAPAIPMVLPERPFSHPVARAVVAERRTLALQPEQAPAVRRGLAAIVADPQAFDDDVVVYLGLTAAAARLRWMRQTEGLQAVIDLLWDIALRLEDGALSLAEADLRAAEAALREALESGADAAEIAALMDALRQALDEYLAQLSQTAEGESLLDSETLGALDPEGMLLSRDDLQALVDQAQDMAMTGATDAAQEMLDELQRLLESLRAQSQLPSQEGEGESLLRELEQIMSDQNELLQETFDRAQARGQDRNQDASGGDPAAQAQESLRRALGDVMRSIGESGEPIPDGLGRAERAMRDAREDLRNGRPDRAAESQAFALQQLQEGATTLIERMMANSEGQGRRLGRRGREIGSDEGRDPLGRRPPGNRGDATGYVEIPEVSDIQRSREILDELYRRAGERQRPEGERDYIERLLRWY